MKILAIETSCDETAVALLRVTGESPTKLEILGNALYSQTATHAPLGGVVPSLAKREHARNLVPLLTQVLEHSLTNYSLILTNKRIVLDEDISIKVREILSREEGLAEALIAANPVKPEGLDAIAVTEGPGLEPALWVGINFVKALSLLWSVPVIPINHMEGHIFSSLLEEKGADNYQLSTINFPLLALLISGGHTELVLAEDFGKYKIVGETQDDAVGEAFDKVARMLGLPYPGGPEISKLAEHSRALGTKEQFSLPRPMLKSDNCDFSFSGLKTAVLYSLKNFTELGEKEKQTVAREFEDSVTEVLLAKTLRALEETGAKTLVLGGGVSANTHIRRSFTEKIGDKFPEVILRIPTPSLTTDNAVMIGLAAFFKKETSRTEIIASGTLRL